MNDLKDNTGRVLTQLPTERPLSLEGKRLASCIFPPGDWKGSNFEGCDLRGADFRNCNLANSSFVNCELDNVLMEKAILTSACFFSSRMRGADMSNIRAEGSFFTLMNMGGSILRFADLYWAIFIQTNLDKANCHGASLQGISADGLTLRGADLTNANLGPDNIGQPTNLTKVNLMESILVGIDLTTTIVNWNECSLRGAFYSDTTKFPRHVHPRELKMNLQKKN